MNTSAFALHVYVSGAEYEALPDSAVDIGILMQSGTENPTCYFANDPIFETIRAGTFVGSVAEGGSVNHQTLHWTTHGNGTHTECFGHISADFNGTMAHCFTHILTTCLLVSQQPAVRGNDLILDNLQDHVWQQEGVEALAVRTLPNGIHKTKKKYSGTNPPYWDKSVTEKIGKAGYRHLLTDLPSLDREQDGGLLSAHKSFFGWPTPFVPYRSVTELIFVPDSVPDGLYLLCLQILRIQSDASPSRPVLISLKKV